MSIHVPSQQKALFLVAKQGDFKLDITSVVKPTAGEVLVRIESAALNPFDHKVKDYGIVVTEFPVILGCEGAGTVVEVGDSVTNVVVGDRVMYQGEFSIPRGTYQQYGIASADLVTKIPAKFSFDEAAAIPNATAGPIIGLYSPKGPMGGAGLTPPWVEGGLNKYAGEPILIIGGASGVGQGVIQFAKLSGFSPIITTASPANHDLVKSLGATHVLDRSVPLTSASLSALVPSLTTTKFKYIFDTIGTPDTHTAAYALLASGGSLITVGHIPIDETEPKEKTVIVLWGVFWAPQNRELAKEALPYLTALLESGQIKTNAAEVLPGGLLGVSSGLDLHRNQQVHAKKLVVHPQETAQA